MDERGLFGIPLVLLIVLSTLLVPVRMQDSSLFGLSIDCGSETDYIDSGISWVTDAGFITTGKNVQNLTVSSDDTITNEVQAQSLRYFDEGRGRDCYVLSLEQQQTYLVRLTFYYGDWDSPANLTTFNVYLNGNNWLDFLFEKGKDYNITYTHEALVYMTVSTLDICLVRGEGTPFISSLELRNLSSGMYHAVVGNNKYMGMFSRINAGPVGVNTYIRFPNDQYDRIWYAPSYSLSSASIVTGLPSFPGNVCPLCGNSDFTTTNSDTPEQAPFAVFEGAWIDDSSPALSYVAIGDFAVGPIAVYGYFEDPNATASTPKVVRGMDFYVNEFLIDSFNISDQPYEVSSCILDVEDTLINITVKQASWSEVRPILNAFEIYFVYDWNGSRTSDDEVNLIRGVANVLNLTTWTGDPCIPVPYDWLRCSVLNQDEGQTTFHNSQTRSSVVTDNLVNVTGMSLSNIATIETFPPEISSLTALNLLNLSNTGLASIPSSSLSGLQYLSILDVSNNRLSGSVPNFLQTIQNTNLQELNAANNSLEGEISIEQLLAEFPNLKNAIFDSNPNTNSNLNLTSWYTYMSQQSLNSGNAPTSAAVTEAAAPSPAPSLSFPSVSMRNNNIQQITPSLDVLTPVIAAYLQKLGTKPFGNITGILLAGNPWCEQTQPLEFPQSFLCRNSTSELFSTGNLFYMKKSDEGFIGIVVGGVGMIAFIVCVLLAVIWRLRRQTSSLKQIQEALARQKVQPRFFAYSDLKRATNEFSSELRLGQGTFGAVYKGQVIDGEDGKVELVAVKELFPSKQALPEFLNEAVLITGIKHRNLVQLKGICIDHKDQRFLVYEYAGNGNLGQALWDNKNRAEQEMSTTLDWQLRMKICVGLARGLSYLHEELQPRIIHRDIKPANILLDKDYDAKIADFGLARSIVEGQTEPDFTTIAGTRGYFSPEYATQGQLTEKADVFAFGVVLLEIVSGRKSIDLSLPEKQQFLQPWARDLKSQGRLLDLLDPAVRSSADAEEVIRVINLAFLCLDFFPELRPTMSEAVTMLQGIMDVKLYKPELKANSTPLRREGSYNYMRMSPTLESLLSDESPSDSFYLIDTTGSSSVHNHDLELSKLSGR